MSKLYLGVDVGSVSTNLVTMDEAGEVRQALYLRTQGRPLDNIKRGLSQLELRGDTIAGVGTTGSARNLAAAVLGADVVKNEITAHAVASSTLVPGVQTILEIGGQDSKIIILRNSVVTDFAMNTVCAAGTGSFLDQQAGRLGIAIEDFGDIAVGSTMPVRIAGRCSVFAESDMIHKQQLGHNMTDILAGLCEAMVRNYLNNVGKGKDIQAPVVFQGGVAANKGIRKAFEKALGLQVEIPQYYNVMGAVGSAILAKEAVANGKPSNFRGISTAGGDFCATSFECTGCPNLCEIVQIGLKDDVLARWGDRCGKWGVQEVVEPEKIVSA
ncbi:MAG TPA: acyl-CoA dehydratase activase [Candidatus Deferrimicrobium sp.]|nr:acyl-CoA dehydratase activase [Candidatus Deferrimicrobium sp.]